MNRGYGISATALLAALSLPSGAVSCDIAVGNAAIYAAHPAATSAALYMDLSNNCDRTDRLVSVTSESAKVVTMHATEETPEGVVVMKALEDGIELPPGEATTRLSPGGNHVMLMGLVEPPSMTPQLPFTLHFASGKKMPILADMAFNVDWPESAGNGD